MTVPSLGKTSTDPVSWTVSPAVWGTLPDGSSGSAIFAGEVSAIAGRCAIGRAAPTSAASPAANAIGAARRGPPANPNSASANAPIARPANNGPTHRIRHVMGNESRAETAAEIQRNAKAVRTAGLVLLKKRPESAAVMRIHGSTPFTQKRACPTANPPGINHPHAAAAAACPVRIRAFELLARIRI